MVSAIDFLPTLLEVMHQQHPTPQRLQGRSFVPLLKGQSQDNRDFVVLQYNENSGRNRHPMRRITTTDRLYLYNVWPNGERKFATATTGTSTYRQMVKLAPSNPTIAARLQLFDYRVVEEMYDIENDPDCLVNLINNPDYSSDVEALRSQLAESLAAMNDPVAPLLADVTNVALREEFMRAEDGRMAEVKAQRARKKQHASEE